MREIDTYPNMEYSDSRNRVFAYKSDLVDSIVRACARKLKSLFSTISVNFISLFCMLSVLNFGFDYQKINKLNGRLCHL